MGTRRLAVVCVPVVFIAGLMAFALALAPDKSVALKLEHVAATGDVYDSDTGERKSIGLRFSLHHQGSGWWGFNSWGTKAEARVAGQWVRAEKFLFPIDEEVNLYVIVPREADLCRVWIAYNREPWNWRLWKDLSRRGVLGKCERLDKWLAPEFPKKWPKPKLASFKLRVPRPPEGKLEGKGYL
jgi:hypothetical protein